jgi:hypothetical protein
MPVYTVKKIKQIESGGEGEKAWTRQKVRIETPDGVKDVLLFCNKWAPVPQEGSTIEAEIGPPYRPGQLPELKRPRKGAYNGSSGASKDFKADPVKQAAIAMEASQKAAVELVKLAYTSGEPVKAFTKETAEVAQELYEQIQRAMKDAG